MKNNVLSNVQTHFLQGVSIIQEARDKFSIASENYTYPLKHYGDPSFDDYYAEIWTDGMDWNAVYWLLESVSIEKPKVIPLLEFSEGEERAKFNDRDFYRLLAALVWKSKAIKEDLDQKGRFFDDPWAYLKPTDISKTYDSELFIKCYYGHGSQEDVFFWVNNKFLIYNEYKNIGIDYNTIDKDDINEIRPNNN